MSPVLERAADLRTLFEIERELVRTLATLVPRLAPLELKFSVCEHVWESAQRARFLRERGRELSGFGSGEGVRPSIRRIFEEALRGPDATDMLAAVSLVLCAELRLAYETYADATQPLADWPTRNLVGEFEADLVRQDTELAPWIASAASSPWTAHLREVFDGSGGWEGDRASSVEWLSDTSPYTHPELPNRGAAPICADAHGDDPAEVPIVRPWLADPETDPRIVRAMIFVWLLNEADAVDYLPTIFYDTPDAPFDFHYDLARHVWDESRHSRFGLRQLPRLGIDLETVEQQVVLYDVLVRMRPHERYVMVTWHFEAGSFDIKAAIMDRVSELSDFESDTLLAFDRSDEQNHVRFGHRWLPTLLELMDDDREPRRFADETWDRFVELEREASARIGHELPRERRLTGDRIAELVASSPLSG